MFGSMIVASDYWRHFIPFAPDIEVSVTLGQEVFIDLEPYIIQGARDFFDSSSPDPLVLPLRVPVQRGWRLDYIAEVMPKKGTLRKDEFKQGFIYRPYGEIGNTEDCFNYQFSNGTQKSNFGKISINVIEPFKVDWKIYAKTRDDVTGISPARFRMSISVAANHPSFFLDTIHGFRWYYERIYVDQDGFVRNVRTFMYGFETFTNSDQRTTMIDRARNLSERTFKTDADIVGIDPRTNLRYVPTNKFPKIECEFWNFPHSRRVYYASDNPAFYLVTDMSRPEVYTLPIESLFTRSWNTSGKIILPPPV
jgi:hypothetical protein